jgi:hypothetical protein
MALNAKLSYICYNESGYDLFQQKKRHGAYKTANEGKRQIKIC